jgi:hypothetical protein
VKTMFFFETMCENNIVSNVLTFKRFLFIYLILKNGDVIQIHVQNLGVYIVLHLDCTEKQVIVYHGFLQS